MVNNNIIGWGLLGLGEIGPISPDEFFFCERSRAEQQSVLYYTPNKTYEKTTTFFWLWRRTSRSSARNSIAYEEQIVNKTVGGGRSHVGSPIFKKEILKNDGEKNKSVKRVVVKEGQPKKKKMSNRKVLDVSFSTPQC